MSRQLAIDLNCDAGEGFGCWRVGDDEALLGIVTSVNVACGFHAGDPSIMRETCLAAAQRGVTIGAQVSYPDLVGFGRRFIDVEPERLRDDVIYQIAALDGFARISGTAVRYVKPHGALYNALVTHPGQAAAVVDAVHDYDPGLPVLGLPGSQLLLLAARRGLRTVAEAFADRAYTPDGHLVPRRRPLAVIQDPDTVAHRCVRIATRRNVESEDGSTLTVDADSICVHSDTPGAPAVARAVRRALEASDVTLRSFA